MWMSIHSIALACALLCITPSAAASDIRRMNSVLGALVADAAAMPLHWIYNDSLRSELLASRNLTASPEFFPVQSCPYYSAPPGGQTPYGNQTLIYLEVLGASRGSVVPKALAKAYYAAFKPPYAWVTRYQGFVDTNKGYLDGSTRGFLVNYSQGSRPPQCGANDDQGNAVAHMVPIVARWAGHPTMLQVVEQITRITQNTDRAVALARAAARILESILLGSNMLHAVTTTAAELQSATRSFPLAEDTELGVQLTAVVARGNESHADVMHTLACSAGAEAQPCHCGSHHSCTGMCQCAGMTCDYPWPLLGAAHLAVRYSESPNYAGAVRETIRAGGDVGSRGNLVGAFFGAANEAWVVPASWAHRTASFVEAKEHAAQMLYLH